MPLDIGIWRVDQGLQRIEFSPLDLEDRLQDILDKDITIADPNWMVVGREVRTSSQKEIDLLAMDSDSNLIVIEVKRDRTPRDIVAQVLDYGSWVVTLRSEDIGGIFSSYISRYHSERDNVSLDEAFCQRFGLDEMPHELNQTHQLVIVASSLDPATERIVKYLAEAWGMNINVIFFRVFKEGDREYLTRAWLSEPSQEQADIPDRRAKLGWNGEYYVSFGESEHRNWEDAVKYGFISAGGGRWYTNTLYMLKPGDRIWVNIPPPGKGYVGVGEVTASAVPFDRFLVAQRDGHSVPITQLPVKAANMFDAQHGEHLVGVRWIKTVPANGARRERGFFGNQNTVARPRDPKWNYTVERLKKHFELI